MTTRRLSGFRRALLALGLLLSACAFAQTRASASSTGWSGTAGAAPAVFPKYVGGEQLEVLPLPIAFVSYDDWLYVDLFRAGAYVWGSDDRKKGVSIAFEPRLGFHASDGARLAGMATRRGSLSGGPTFDWQGDAGALSLAYLYDLSNSSRGGYVDILLSRPVVHDDLWDASATLELARLDSKVVNYYFGVAPSEATAERPSYQPGATTNVTLWLTGQRNLTRRYALMFGANVMRLGDEAADSPIVERRYVPFVYLGIGINL